MIYDVSWRLTTSISGTSVTTYTFDSNGNLTNVRPATGNRTTMAYDKENRLVDWKQGAATNATTYKYNGFGQKVNETNATGFNAYALIWDGDDYRGDVVEGVDGPVCSNLIRAVDGVMMGQVQDDRVDFLGSITGTTNVTTGAIVNTYRTKPYGAKLSGGTIGLRFFWTGNTGYRSTGREPSERYIRAWHFSSVVGRCSTREILWSAEAICGCVLANPVAWVYCSRLKWQNTILRKLKPKSFPPTYQRGGKW
jgi:YD repeat-containing protein